ncbi:TatD related DNase [Pseudoscourfieldia marina]
MSQAATSAKSTPESEQPTTTQLLSSTFFDAHTHVHLDERQHLLERTARHVKSLRGAGLMATGDDDWEDAVALATACDNARLCIGVHPWFAHRYARGDGKREWLERLRKYVTTTPGACVGEIGLDRQWVTPDTGQVEYDAQREVFEAQLALAAELEVPVSVHCVRAQGHLAEALAAAPSLPPAIYMHAFGGTLGTLEQLVRSRKYGDRMYFGFATCINLRSPKTPSVIAAVPDDRLLLESDRESSEHVDEELRAMLCIYADAKGWTVEEAARRTAENAERFYAAAVR